MRKVVPPKTHSTNHLLAKHKQNKWLEVLKATQVRALASVSKDIAQLINSDTVDANHIAKLLLKDAGLTAQVLKVANSVVYKKKQYSPKYDAKNLHLNQGSELRQAIVRIGFNGVRAICITIALIENLTKHPEKQQRLLQCLVKSFHVAMQSQNVAMQIPRCRTDDVFIAALLQNIGELVFWASPIPESTAYQSCVKALDGDYTQAVLALTSMSFIDMSRALAETWSLSETLSETFNSRVRNREVKAVRLGVLLSRAVEAGWDSDELQQTSAMVADELDIDQENVLAMAKEAVEQTEVMAEQYKMGGVEFITPQARSNNAGNDILLNRAVNSAKDIHQASQQAETDFVVREPDADAQVAWLDQLWELNVKNADHHQACDLLVRGIYDAAGMERVVVFVLADDTNSLTMQSWTDDPTGQWSKQCSLAIDESSASALALCLQHDTTVRFSAQRMIDFDKLVTAGLKQLFGEQEHFLMAPLKNGKQLFGLLYADLGVGTLVISDAHFASVSRLVKQFNAALTIM